MPIVMSFYPRVLSALVNRSFIVVKYTIGSLVILSQSTMLHPMAMCVLWVYAFRGLMDHDSRMQANFLFLGTFLLFMRFIQSVPSTSHIT